MTPEEIAQTIRSHIADIIGDMHDVVHENRHLGEAALSGIVTTVLSYHLNGRRGSFRDHFKASAPVSVAVQETVAIAQSLSDQLGHKLDSLESHAVALPTAITLGNERFKKDPHAFTMGYLQNTGIS